MRGSTLLVLLSSLLLPLVAAYDDGYPLGRRTGLHLRRDTNSSASAPGPSAALSSASSPQSSSAFKSSHSSSRSSTTTSSFTSSSSSTTRSSTTSSSSTSVITTESRSSSVSLPPSSSISPSSASVSVTSAALVGSPPPTAAFKPTSTFNVGPNLATTGSGEQPSDSAAAKSNVNAASTGFWGNKGAVGGTFTVVALLVVGVFAGLIVVLRRRAASRNSARDTFYDTKGPVDRSDSHHSPGPSMVSLGNEPMDAHAAPIPNYGSADQYLVDTGDYNYPPGASYANTNVAPEQYYSTADPQQQQHYQNAVDQQQQQQYHAGADNTAAYFAEANAYESYNQHYSSAGAAAEEDTGHNNGYSVTPANHRPSLSPHPYSHPAHLNPPPSALRDFPGRDSYQPSIDSFYGAAGTAV